MLGPISSSIHIRIMYTVNGLCMYIHMFDVNYVHVIVFFCHCESGWITHRIRVHCIIR